MKMREIDLAALGLTPEHGETMDELVPGWRDMTPTEFADRLPEQASAVRRQALAMQRTLEEMERDE